MNKNEPRKYVVYIGWAETPELGQESMEYEFDTQAELDAFMFGVNECDGWNDFIAFEEPHTYVENAEGDGEWIPDSTTVEVPHEG